MPTIVGQTCVQCHKAIDSAGDGEFCPCCTQPVHHACMVRTIATSAGCCRWCGSSVTDPAAVQRLLETMEALQAAKYRQEASLSQGNRGRGEIALGVVMLLLGLLGLRILLLGLAVVAGGLLLIVRGIVKMTRS